MFLSPRQTNNMVSFSKHINACFTTMRRQLSVLQYFKISASCNLLWQYKCVFMQSTVGDSKDLICIIVQQFGWLLSKVIIVKQKHTQKEPCKSHIRIMDRPVVIAYQNKPMPLPRFWEECVKLFQQFLNLSYFNNVSSYSLRVSTKLVMHFYNDSGPCASLLVWCQIEYIHYRQKIWNIFNFSDFLYFLGCVGYIFIWLTFLQVDINFGELIYTQ